MAVLVVRRLGSTQRIVVVGAEREDILGPVRAQVGAGELHCRGNLVSTTIADFMESESQEVVLAAVLVPSELENGSTVGENELTQTERIALLELMEYDRALRIMGEGRIVSEELVRKLGEAASNASDPQVEPRHIETRAALHKVFAGTTRRTTTQKGRRGQTQVVIRPSKVRLEYDAGLFAECGNNPPLTELICCLPCYYCNPEGDTARWKGLFIPAAVLCFITCPIWWPIRACKLARRREAALANNNRDEIASVSKGISNVLQQMEAEFDQRKREMFSVAPQTSEIERLQKELAFATALLRKAWTTVGVPGTHVLSLPLRFAQSSCVASG